MLTKFFPWKFLLRRLSRTHGFIDPFALLARFNRFAQPAEMVAPYELLRAGAVMHARGLLNSQAIQHNLDWIWPFWVEEQFNPGSKSFIPRAFALTHINLTHRNWTAIGIPGMHSLPIVDPRGLLTPVHDGWSIDCWILDRTGDHLLPSRCAEVRQTLPESFPLRIITESSRSRHRLIVTAEADVVDGTETCYLHVKALTSDIGARLVISLRPYNPEGVSLLESIQESNDAREWVINRRHRCVFDQFPSRLWHSTYRTGDVYHTIIQKGAVNQPSSFCDVGMASSAAEFLLTENTPREISVTVPLGARKKVPSRPLSLTTWHEQLERACMLNIPDKHYMFLYKNALHTMLLHSPDDIFAGPYTYHRFWFRDAVLIAHAMALSGLTDRACAAVGRFSRRQNASGYYESQEGEWDSNGQVLWIYDLLDRLTGSCFHRTERRSVIHAADWIRRKLVSDECSTMHQGLLPAGFSAEHLGPNDYYFWDDFWAVAGLRAAARMSEAAGDLHREKVYRDQAAALLDAINSSLRRFFRVSGNEVMPPSPYRRPDSASVGSLVAGYPLLLFEGRDRRLIETAVYLYKECSVENALFHDVSHSGINPYLTLHVAQTLLRAHDVRYASCMEAIAKLASPTGQWPEAIHPQLGTGCMGDGQHVWAAAEWVCMVRNLFVMEECDPPRLLLCTGLLPRWFLEGSPCTLGPAPTSFGMVTVRTVRNGCRVEITWEGRWNAGMPEIEISPVWGRLVSRTDSSASVEISDKITGESSG